jgi:hypothetical protein
MIEDFTILNWARAAVAMNYQFTSGWERNVRQEMFSNFTHEIRFEEDYDMATCMLPTQQNGRGRQRTDNVHKMIRKRMNTLRSETMKHVKQITGWDLSFRSLLNEGGKPAWLFGKGTIEALAEILPVKKTGVSGCWEFRKCRKEHNINQCTLALGGELEKKKQSERKRAAVSVASLTDSTAHSTLTNKTLEMEKKLMEVGRRMLVSRIVDLYLKTFLFSI